MELHQPASRLVVTVPEAAELLGISSSFAYELIHRNEIPHVRLGRRVVVPTRELERFIHDAAAS